ncbi:CesT family type III secretion system chaperone [Acidovorax sp. NCPPB 4044]|uniref:CesT family type III secretion system chaperone n=1 Tax=Acidovorax sp. NCPPB 4044 TaxID=2940490 RepID=UPI0023023409|nr:CesT family type III secretion system chaperone [Acidovorax sp. NCPPB 4044]MDA8522280.1 CesT family type III secretion system chaperone [Acidovorax sp. NCPPB 4044]
MTKIAEIKPVLRAVARIFALDTTPDKLLEGTPFQVNGQTFSLQQPPGDGAAGMIVVRSELGTVPEAKRLQVYEMLLRSNALSSGAFSPVAGMQLDGSALVMDMALPLATLDAGMLHGVLERMASSAEIWKGTQGFTQALDGTELLPPSAIPATGQAVH